LRELSKDGFYSGLIEAIKSPLNLSYNCLTVEMNDVNSKLLEIHMLISKLEAILLFCPSDNHEKMILHYSSLFEMIYKEGNELTS
jgi:hypothetical protein